MLSEQEIQNWKDRIDQMSRVEMARLWRFATSGHPVFNRTLPLSEYFNARFTALGGFSPAISKQIGLEAS